MLRGRFEGARGRPYLDGQLVIPRLSLEAGLSFLVDTGADRTVLMPTDALNMGVDYSGLTTYERSIGASGISTSFVEEGYVSFTEASGTTHFFRIDLRIVPPVSGLEGVLSLLGRDVLNRLRMNYDPVKGRLTFAVVTSDLSATL
jgi:hypothetical protein